MQTIETIIMDGVEYRVHVVPNSLQRSFDLVEGIAEGYMISGRHERDLAGTGYSYQFKVEPNLNFPEDYDDFFDAISAPVDSHTITMPYGQSTMTFKAEIQAGRDIFLTNAGGKNRFHGLTILFKYIELQRSAI